LRYLVILCIDEFTIAFEEDDSPEVELPGWPTQRGLSERHE
jgi:hypothetical protein